MVARGHPAERRTAAALRELGYLVGSRRHEGGPGDLLAWAPGAPPLLAEVKATAGPFDHFAPEDRAAMLEAGERWGVEPLLAWWPPGDRKLFWVPADEWP